MGMACDVDVLLLFQTILYSTLTITAFIVTVCTGTVYTHFGNRCLLFADLNWTSYSNISTEHHHIVNFISSKVNCEFLIATSSIAFVYTFIFGVYHIFVLYKAKQHEEIVHDMAVRPFIAGSFLFSLFTLVMACVVSAGLFYLCNKNKKHFFKSCRDLENDQSWNINPKINSLSSILDIQIAQVALWVEFFMWVAILALTIIRHMKNMRELTSKRIAAHLTEIAGAEMHSFPGDEREETVLFEGYNSRR